MSDSVEGSVMGSPVSESSAANTADTTNATDDTANTIDKTAADTGTGEATQDATNEAANGGEASTQVSGTESSSEAALMPLSDDATPEEMEAYQQRLNQFLGVPDTADGYELPDGTPDEVATVLRNIAHTLNVSPAVLSREAPALLASIAEEQQRAQDQLQATIRQADAALTKAAGSNEAKQALLENGNRVLNNTPGLRDELMQIGALTPDNQVTTPVLAQVIGQLGKLTNEGGLPEGREVTRNPFKDGTATEQSRMLKENPDLARRLMDQANYKL